MNFFFFQAEDGIRDSSVTGVQTCALPICPRAAGHAARVRTSARCARPDVRTRAACPAARGRRPDGRRVRRPDPDRKSVVEGKSVDLGGRRIIKKKKRELSLIVASSHLYFE